MATVIGKKEKALRISSILSDLYPSPEVPLLHRDPFTLLIAVLLSAQCTDERVNKVTPSLFRLAATPEKMAGLGIEEIQAVIRPCGLSPQKSKAIKGLSEILIKHFAGQVPQSFTELEKLPGVGHKTASVVMSQAFGIPAFPVDTHIHRLAYRWALSSGKNVVKTESDLKRLFPEEDWNLVHLQIIFFGREYCPARGHRMRECPVCSRFGRKSLLAKEP